MSNTSLFVGNNTSLLDWYTNSSLTDSLGVYASGLLSNTGTSGFLSNTGTSDTSDTSDTSGTGTKTDKSTWSWTDVGSSILNAGTSIMGMIGAGYKIAGMHQQIKNMKQDYKIKGEMFEDYKKERDRTNKIRTNTQKQFTTGSAIKTNY